MLLCIWEMVLQNFSHGIQILVYEVYGYDTNLEKIPDLGYKLSLSSQFWMKSVVAWVFCIAIGFRSHIWKLLALYSFAAVLIKRPGESASAALLGPGFIIHWSCWWSWPRNLIHHELFIFTHQLGFWGHVINQLMSPLGSKIHPF